jgi:F0F1-type ATP synthase membrane subunit c/vacuolar-type H+-ATPase subunit K
VLPNPWHATRGAATAIRFAMLIGLILIESMALYILVICFIIIFTKA